MSVGIWSGADLVKSILRPFKISSVRFRWALFGSDNQQTYENELVTVRFQRRGPSSATKSSKAFFKIYRLLPRALKKRRRFLDHPHFPPLSSRATIQDGVIAHGNISYDNWVGGRVRHYAVKSPAEYLAKRNLRGDGIFAHLPSVAAYMSAHDLNDVLDPLPDSVIADLRSKVAEITKAIM